MTTSNPKAEPFGFESEAVILWRKRVIESSPHLYRSTANTTLVDPNVKEEEITIHPTTKASILLGSDPGPSVSHGPSLSSGRMSVVSNSTYCTAPSQRGALSEKTTPRQLRGEDEYAQLLSSRKLWPVNADVEQNWSGRGQHVKFEPSEQHLINEILHLNEQLGSTSTAVVQSVKCRRILLARKTILCGKKMPRHVAIEEVSHLTRLSHAHILRVISTYVKGRELSILLYPVAEYNLEGFFEKFHNTPSQSNSWLCMCHSGLKLYFCLSSALLCIHRSLTKHMDIKPQNILMCKTSEKGYYNAYIADFGIARSYLTSEEIETDGRTSFTKRYAAPEVVRQDTRGLSADVFSLGCVFLEIFSTFHSPNIRFRTQSALQTVFTANTHGDLSYQANIAGLQAHLASLVNEFSHLKSNLVMIRRMLNSKPQERPTAEELVAFFEERPCCTAGPLQLQVMDDVQSEEVIEPNT